MAERDAVGRNVRRGEEGEHETDSDVASAPDWNDLVAMVDLSRDDAEQELEAAVADADAENVTDLSDLVRAKFLPSDR